MVVVTTAGAVLSGGCRVAAPWVYLGKSVRTRQRVQARVGSARRLLGNRLHEASAEARQPFLDFVADIGKEQSDPVTWWSTTFSWKVWGASDFFLLLSYLLVAGDLVEEALAQENALVIVVEDQWLLAQIASNWAHHSDVLATPRAGLRGLKAAALTLGLARRLAWLLQTLVGWVRQRRAWPAGSRLSETTATAGIYTYPMDRCLRAGGGWADSLLPGVDDILRKAGHEAIFFSTPERGGFERPIAERHGYFRPLILFLTAATIVRSFLAFWAPRTSAYPDIAGIGVDYLARREWWTDLSRAAWCRNRMFFECASRMLQSGRFAWIVFPFEGQPWEKLLVLAAKQRGVKTAGVQHSTLGLNYLSYFHGRDEAPHIPLPDVVLTSGTFAQSALIDGGYPPDRVLMTGSLRYQHLAGNGEAAAPRSDPPRAHVLVGLPIDRPMAEHLLAALGAAFPDGGRADGLRFFVKCHPMTAVDPVQCGLRAEMISGSFEQALETCGTVIFTGSTTGPEAAARGRAVLRYRPELLIDVDVSGAVSAVMPVCSDDDLRAQLLRLVADRQPRTVPGSAMLESLFAAVDWDILDRVFQRPVTAGPLPTVSPRS